MEISYRRLRKKDERRVFGLLRKTFLRLNGRGLPQKVIIDYLSFLTHENFLHFLDQESFVAVCRGRIVGFGRGRKNRISNLFVEEYFHRRGIGKRLEEKLEEVLFKKTNVIKVRSSLYAVPFYKSMGYTKTTGERKFHGVPIQPMKKIKRKS